jgi:PAS domain S-box-containing protein
MDFQNIIGKKLAGCEITRKIGEGGMGLVYEAIQSSLGRKVAVKLLSPVLGKNQEFVSRFLREARIAAGISHPNVMQVVDAGKDGEDIYMITELIKGKTLKELVGEKGKFSEENSFSIIRDVASALVDAYKSNIVHRDLKPDNVMISENNIVKVMDFGLAKNIVSSEDVLTQTGAIMGTPQYMSPEQIKGENVDIRGDIYSLGLIFYFLVTGKTAFEGKTQVSIMHDQVYKPLPDPRTVNPEISDSARGIILKMTKKDPQDRFQTPCDLLNAVLVAQKDPKNYLNKSSEQDIQPTIHISGRRKKWIFYITAIVVLLAGASALVIFLFPERFSAEKQMLNSLSSHHYRKIVLRWDSNGNVTFLNKYGQAVFGYKEQDILGKSIIGTLVPETEMSGKDLKVMIGSIIKNPDKFQENKNENICSDGSIVIVDWINKAIRSPEGKLKEILSIGKVMSRRTPEEEIKQ